MPSKIITATTTKFDFSQIDAKERYNVWRDSISVIFDMDSKTKIAEELFHAEFSSTQLSSMLLNTTKSQGQNFNRSGRLIAQDNLDHCWIQMFVSGSSSVEFGRQQKKMVQTGDIFLVDFSQPLKILSTDFEDINLIIPRQILQKYLINVEKYHGSILPRDSAFAKILSSHLLTLKSVIPTLSLNESSIIAEGLAHLVGLYFSQQAVPINNDVLQFSTQETIKRYISQNLKTFDLNPQYIAMNFRISRSYLYKIFPNIASYIKQQRLRQAYRELSSLTNNQRISEIAFNLGFNSESDFSRSFQRFFQLTPSDVRYNLAFAAQNNNESLSDKIDLRFEDLVRKL